MGEKFSLEQWWPTHFVWQMHTRARNEDIVLSSLLCFIKFVLKRFSFLQYFIRKINNK